MLLGLFGPKTAEKPPHFDPKPVSSTFISRFQKQKKCPTFRTTMDLDAGHFSPTPHLSPMCFFFELRGREWKDPGPKRTKTLFQSFAPLKRCTLRPFSSFFCRSAWVSAFPAWFCEVPHRTGANHGFLTWNFLCTIAGVERYEKST